MRVGYMHAYVLPVVRLQKVAKVITPAEEDDGRRNRLR